MKRKLLCLFLAVVLMVSYVTVAVRADETGPAETLAHPEETTQSLIPDQTETADDRTSDDPTGEDKTDPAPEADKPDAGSAIGTVTEAPEKKPGSGI